MCRLWNCKGFGSFIDYLSINELSVAVKNSYRCNFGQLVSQIVRQTVNNSSGSQLVLMSVRRSISSQSVKWIKGVRGTEKRWESLCTVTTTVTNSHHHPVTTTTSSSKLKYAFRWRFVFFSTEFDEKAMTTVPGSHLVEPRVYSKASFLILFGGKF